MSLVSRLRALIKREELESELDDELKFHLEMKTRENLAAGMTPQEARSAALKAFGNLARTKENTRTAWTLPRLESVLQDLRYGLRQLRRSPGFSAAAIGIAALGIAATCVIFSFGEAAVLRALPYSNPSRLVFVTMKDLKGNASWSGVPVPIFQNWREQARAIGSFAATSSFTSQTLAGVAEPAQAFNYAVSESAFSLLGVGPALGRGFSPFDFRSGSPPVVLLSDALWHQLFDGRRDALGRTVTLDGVAHTIVGVMPPGFLMPNTSAWETVCWTPLVFNAKQESDTKNLSLSVWGRLRPGVSPEHAEAVLSALAIQVMESNDARSDSDWRIGVTPMIHQVIAQWRSILIVLFGAAAFLLAISCANVANLLVARAASREREIAVRTAIGANRARLVRQLLTESLVLAGMAGGLGILLAHWGIELETRILPRWMRTANFHQMGIDLQVLAAALAVSAVVGIAFGLAPALHASKVDLVESLKEGGASASPRRGRLNTQGILVLTESALSLILLSGAGLMLRSFLKLEGVHPGIEPQQVLTLRVLLPRYRYANAADQIAAYQRLLKKIESVPGVEASGFVSPLPLDGIDGTIQMPAQPGMANLGGSRSVVGELHAVSPGYFKTMGIPLLRGRFFTERDTADSGRVMIVDKAFADRYWPGQNPVGKEIFLDYPKPNPVAWVVGEVGNVRDLSLGAEPRPVMYNPFTQKLFAPFAGTVVVKTHTQASTGAAMQKAIHSLDSEAPISQIATMRQVLSGSLAEKRLYLVVVGAFALLALALAAAGIASTVSYAVSRRKHEVGIRMALGASRSDVVALMVQRTFVLVTAGIATGAAGALLLTRFLASQLYEVTPMDPLTFIAVSVILIAVALLASYIPARRATKVDPMVALRYE